MTKGIAIVFMLLLHLFCTKDYDGLFKSLILIRNVPLIYYFALFGDCCVAIYCFCSGYGLMRGYIKNPNNYKNKNCWRLLKLYLNFWIILVLFVLLIGPLLGQGDVYPGSFKTFMLNLIGINPSYNGAWWFLTTYVFLIMTSSFLNRWTKKLNPWLIVIISLAFYVLAYIQRIKTPFIFDSKIIEWYIRQLALFGTSQFPFIVGILFANYNIYSKLLRWTKKWKWKNICCLTIMIGMLIVHGFIQTLFIAVFTGIIFICVFNLLDKPKWLERVFELLGNHSTNMWFTHMFFYMIYFRKLVYASQNPILIFTVLLLLSLGSSYIIQWIYQKITLTLNRVIEIKFKEVKLINPSQ